MQIKMLKKDLIKLILDTEARLRKDLNNTRKHNYEGVERHISMSRARWATAYRLKKAIEGVK